MIRVNRPALVKALFPAPTTILASSTRLLLFWKTSRCGTRTRSKSLIMGMRLDWFSLGASVVGQNGTESMIWPISKELGSGLGRARNLLVDRFELQDQRAPKSGGG